MRLKQRLLAIYQNLYTSYGPQGWWPTTPPGKTTPVYRPGATSRRLNQRERWEIMVGALLTQNTTWHNAELCLEALSASGSLDLRELHDLPLEQLSGLIRPARYFNQKAQRLHDLAGYVLEAYGGSIAALTGRPPAELRPELYFFETEALWCFFELFWGGRFWHGLHSGSHLFIFEDFTKLRKESN